MSAPSVSIRSSRRRHPNRNTAWLQLVHDLLSEEDLDEQPVSIDELELVSSIRNDIDRGYEPLIPAAVAA